MTIMRFFMSATLLLEATAIQAQNSDLLQIYRLALLHDVQYTAAKAQQRIGEEHWLQGRAGLLPQISLNTQSNWVESYHHASTGSTEQNRQNQSYSIQLIQPIFRWQNWVQFEQGELQRAQAQIHLESATQALLLRVAHAYFEVLNSTDALRAVHDLRTANAEQLATAKKNFELGNISIIDVNEAQASFDRSMAQFIKAKSDFHFSQYALVGIIGQHPGMLRGLQANVTLPPPQPSELDTWIKLARQYNLNVQAQELLLGIASNEVRIHKAEHLPSIDLVLNHGMQQNPNTYTNRTDSSSIGLHLSMPLYSGGRLSSTTRQAVAMQEKTEFELEDARRSAALAATQAWSGVIDGIAQEKALAAAKSSALLAATSNQIGYKVGVRVGIDVLEAQRKYSDIVQQLSRTRYDILLAQLKLKAAAGTLSEVDIAEINTLLSD
ncbi:channel protein TolC [Pseudomonas sp. HMWF031]|nr:channel protein TolC [Pseudomonas sp. HMWF031]